MNSAVELINVSKTFPKTKRYRELLTRPFSSEYIKVLEDVSLTIDQGEIFGLAGPNGAGKTTLLKIIGSIMLPTMGTVKIHGMDLAKNHYKAKQKIGFVFTAERSFFYRLSGKQNLEFFGVLNNLKNAELDAKINKTLEITGLAEFAGMEFMKYSAGMQQKLAIARALILEPELLILDEPTKSLDPIASAEFHDLIRNLSKDKGMTTIIASHNLHEIEELCGRVAVLNKGKLNSVGSPESIKAKFKYLERGLEVVRP